MSILPRSLTQMTTSYAKPGDPNNIEARAARAYWRALFPNFHRHDDNDRRNGLLNYGYAILRSALARALTASGLLPSLGIHHRSLQNAFNLADDLLEPYRPMADWLACQHAEDAAQDDPLSLQDRQKMIGVLSLDASLEEETMPVFTAMERTAMSLVQAFSQSDARRLALPKMG